MQTLVPLSTLKRGLVTNVNIVLILVRAGLLNNCVETADESPQKPKMALAVVRVACGKQRSQ